jgi:protein-L-isoaspartate(D-aspartate) O-methyltransferase
MNIETARFNMIEQQIRPWDVLDPAVLSLLATVRREDFVPPAMRALAFVDTQVPLLPGQPTARACWSPRSKPGCCRNCRCSATRRCSRSAPARGFMAALLAHRAQQVLTLECQPDLARQARDNLRATAWPTCA